MVNVISPKIRVVQAAEGRVVEVEVPDLQITMTVGELMLEFPPGHFVAHFNHADLANGGHNAIMRASPLGADAEAKSGHVYVLFPMPRLHTRVTPHELLTFAKLLHLHHLQLACKGESDHKLPSTRKHRRSGTRVAPFADVEDDILGSAGAHTATQAAEAASCPQQDDEQESLMMLCPINPPISSQTTPSCHGQMQVIRSKPWAPKLETIREIS